jgi:hypothetical protein
MKGLEFDLIQSQQFGILFVLTGSAIYNIYCIFALNHCLMARLSLIFLLINFMPITSSSQEIYMTRTGTVQFVSDAPLEVIKAVSIEMQGAINPLDKTFAFVIDNKSFKGFNSPLQQEHFYENYMQVRDYPKSTFEGKIIEKIDLQSAAEQTIRAKGILNVHGVEQERIIKGTIKITGDKIILHAGFTIPLEEHRIKIPKVVYQKIAEIIDVQVDAELTRKTQ